MGVTGNSAAGNPTEENKKKFDIVDFLMALDDNQLSEDEIVDGMQRLIDSGVINSLEGRYGRYAQQLINAGKCRPAGGGSNGAFVEQDDTIVDPQQHIWLRNVGPYRLVSKDKLRTYPNGRTFRFVLYGGEHVGATACEFNGILILDEDNKDVVADEIARQSSGYYGPSDLQKEVFRRLMTEDYDFLREVVNTAPRKRMQL